MFTWVSWWSAKYRQRNLSRQLELRFYMRDGLAEAFVNEVGSLGNELRQRRFVVWTVFRRQGSMSPSRLWLRCSVRSEGSACRLCLPRPLSGLLPTGMFWTVWLSYPFDSQTNTLETAQKTSQHPHIITDESIVNSLQHSAHRSSVGFGLVRT